MRSSRRSLHDDHQEGIDFLLIEYGEDRNHAYRKTRGAR